MTEIIKNIDYFDFNLTLIRVLKLVGIFENKEKYKLTFKKIVLFDYYLRFPFMNYNEQKKQNYDEKYAFFFWKPNYLLYEAVLSVLVSKEFILYKDDLYKIKEKGKEALDNMKCSYMDVLSNSGQYILNRVVKLTEKQIEEDIIKKSQDFKENING